MKKKQHTTKEIRGTSREVIIEMARGGKQSLRKLASLINRSRSSVHRHEQSLEKRNQYPESMLWETEAGQAWLKLLYFAVLYTFGMECHIGADKLANNSH